MNFVSQSLNCQDEAFNCALVFFVPMGDIYYFLSNIWEYFGWFCVKYVGVAVRLLGWRRMLGVRASQKSSVILSGARRRVFFS